MAKEVLYIMCDLLSFEQKIDTYLIFQKQVSYTKHFKGISEMEPIEYL